MLSLTSYSSNMGSRVGSPSYFNLSNKISKFSNPGECLIFTIKRKKNNSHINLLLMDLKRLQIELLKPFNFVSKLYKKKMNFIRKPEFLKKGENIEKPK